MRQVSAYIRLRLVPVAIISSVLATAGGCGNGGMYISGQVVSGGQPVTIDPEGFMVLSLMDDEGNRFEFNTDPDGTFSGPTSDDPRQLKPGTYDVMLTAYPPGAMSPLIVSKPDGIELKLDQDEYLVDVPPLPKSFKFTPPAGPKG